MAVDKVLEEEEEEATELMVIVDKVLEEEEQATELTSIVDQAVVEEVISVLIYLSVPEYVRGH